MDDKDMPLLPEENIPYYVRIYDTIYQLIQDGVLKEGDTLPGENILAKRWNVSRSTVRAAIRKLEEDGYIYKMQGRKTMITGQLARNKHGLHHMSNPCLSCCVGAVTQVEILVSIQNGGRLIGDLLGYGERIFTVVSADLSYFVGDTCVATSVAIIPLSRLEKEGIAVDDIDKLKELALTGIYQSASRSHLSMSAVRWSGESQELLCCQVGIIMDEVFYEGETPLAYHKYRMDSNWYRFSIDRKS